MTWRQSTCHLSPRELPTYRKVSDLSFWLLRWLKWKKTCATALKIFPSNSVDWISEKNSMWQYQNGFKGSFNFCTSKLPKARLHNSLLVKLLVYWLTTGIPNLQLSKVFMQGERPDFWSLPYILQCTACFLCKMMTKGLPVQVTHIPWKNYNTIHNRLCWPVN